MKLNLFIDLYPQGLLAEMPHIHKICRICGRIILHDRPIRAESEEHTKKECLFYGKQPYINE